MNILAAIALSALVLVGGCSGSSSGDAGKTRVVAAFYPFAFVAEQVGGSHVAVDNLTAVGAEPHDLELKPKQVGAVQNADLVIYEKHFQAAVDQAVEQSDRSASNTIDVMELVTPLPAPAETGHGGQHDDPHVWLDPTNMIAVTKAVATRLSAADPEHRTDFADNAAALTAKLQTLDQAFATGLAACRTNKFVTSHAAFGYLAKRYGLEQVSIAGIEPSNEPSPAQLAAITRLVQRDHITTIFTEELVSPAIADTVARSTGATTATLDPIEGLSDDTADEDYLSLMNRNLDALKKACA